MITSTSLTTDRRAELRTALRLECLTIVWMLIEAGVAIGSGWAASSLLLMAFGADSVIELISAIVLFIRLRLEFSSPLMNEAAINRAERNAARISGYLLFGLAGYVLLQSSFGLLRHTEAASSRTGLALAIVAAVAMPVLARAKLRVASRIGSRALRADAMETLTCGYLSWILLCGLAANWLLHWWWIDSAAALILVPFLIKEGREAITGDCGCSA